MVVGLVGESTRFVAVEGMALSRMASRSFSRGWWSCSGRLGMADMITCVRGVICDSDNTLTLLSEGRKRWNVRYRGQEDQKCRNETPYKAYTVMIRSYILYVRKQRQVPHVEPIIVQTETGTTCGAHHRPCSRSPQFRTPRPPPSASGVLPIAKVDPSEASMTLTAVGSSLTSPSRQKVKQAQDAGDRTCNKVTGLHRKVDPLYSENVRGAQKVGQAIVWGLGLAACGDLRKIGSFEGRQGQHGRCFRHKRQVEYG